MNVHDFDSIMDFMKGMLAASEEHGDILPDLQSAYLAGRRHHPFESAREQVVFEQMEGAE